MVSGLWMPIWGPTLDSEGPYGILLWTLKARMGSYSGLWRPVWDPTLDSEGPYGVLLWTLKAHMGSYSGLWRPVWDPTLDSEGPYGVLLWTLKAHMGSYVHRFPPAGFRPPPLNCHGHPKRKDLWFKAPARGVHNPCKYVWEKVMSR
jgi:hypothetical protein